MLILIPETWLCLSPVHDKVSDMKGYGLQGNGRGEGVAFENMWPLFDWHQLIDRVHTLGLLNRLSYWFISHQFQTPHGLMRRVLIQCRYEHPRSCDWCLRKNIEVKNKAAPVAMCFTYGWNVVRGKKIQMLDWPINPTVIILMVKNAFKHTRHTCQKDFSFNTYKCNQWNSGLMKKKNNKWW